MNVDPVTPGLKHYREQTISYSPMCIYARRSPRTTLTAQRTAKCATLKEQISQPRLSGQRIHTLLLHIYIYLEVCSWNCNACIWIRNAYILKLVLCIAVLVSDFIFFLKCTILLHIEIFFSIDGFHSIQRKKTYVRPRDVLGQTNNFFLVIKVTNSKPCKHC